MIEYAMKILPKVSPWKPLFSKELKKCIQWIDPNDQFEFYEWCSDNFYHLYPDVLNEAFKDVKAVRTRTIPGSVIKSAMMSAKKSALQNTA